MSTVGREPDAAAEPSSAAPPLVLVAVADGAGGDAAEATLLGAGFRVARARATEEAWRALIRERPTACLVLADAHIDPAELTRRVRGLPEGHRLPMVAEVPDRRARLEATEAGADAVLPREHGCGELLVQLRAVLHRVLLAHLADERQPLTAVSGSLRDVTPHDVLEALRRGRRDAVILFEAAGLTATVAVSQGQVVDAELGDLSGDAAVLGVLTWIGGRFRVTPATVRQLRTVAVATEDLLGEGLRRLRERQVLLQALPGAAAILMVDFAAAERLASQLPERAAEVLQLVDGRRSIAELLVAASGSDLEALATLKELLGRAVVYPLAERRVAADEIPRLEPWSFGGAPPSVAAPPETAPAELGRIQLAQRDPRAVVETVRPASARRPPPPPGSDTADLPRRRRLPVVLGLVCLIAIVGVLWWVSGPAGTVAPPPPSTDVMTAARRALEAGRLDEAIHLAEQAQVVRPAAGESFYILGSAHERSGRTEDARRFYERYLSLEPSGPHASEIRRRLEQP